MGDPAEPPDHLADEQAGFPLSCLRSRQSAWRNSSRTAAMQTAKTSAHLQKISTGWEQGECREKGGWATRQGSDTSDYHLARACAEKLAQVKTVSQ